MFGSKKRHVKSLGDNLQACDKLLPVFQSFADKIGQDIFFSNPHHRIQPVYTGEEFGLCVYFWAIPPEVSDSFHGGDINMAYGYPTVGDSQSSSYILSFDRTIEGGTRIVDSEGETLALIFGKTLYVLFDLPHWSYGQNNAVEIMKRILDDYFLYLSNAVRFEREMCRRIEGGLESRFTEIYKDALTEDVDYEPEELKTTFVSKKLQLLSTVRDMKTLLNAKSDKPAEIEDAKIEAVFKGLEKISVTGKIRVAGNVVYVPVGQIDIEYDEVVYDIGEFDVAIDMVKHDVKCFNRTRIVGGDNHPHVNDDGYCCLGDASYGMDLFLKSMQLEVVVLMMIQFLKSYNDDNFYEEIDSWPEKEVKRGKKR